MLVDRLASIFRPQAKLTPTVDPQQMVQYLPYQMLAGVRLTMDEAMRVSAVWACMDAITKPIVSSPWNVISIGPDLSVTQMPADPLRYVLNTRANPHMTAIACKEALMYCALSGGNGYAEIVKNGAGDVVELWPLPPDGMLPQLIGGVLWYVYRSTTGIHTPVMLRPDQVYHLKGPSLSGYMGDNLVVRAARTIALAAAAERFSSSYFGNSTVVGGTLQYPGKLDEPSYQRIKADWAARKRGPDAAHSPVILEGGMKWEPETVNAEQAQLVESRKFSIEDIARFYGVPLHKIQLLDKMTFNNIEELELEFTRGTLTPWTLRNEQEADYKLLPPKDARSTKIDTAWLTYGKAAERAEFYQTMRRIGVFTIDDVLRLEGRNTIGGIEGESRMVEMNMQTIDALLAEPARPEGPRPGDPHIPRDDMLEHAGTVLVTQALCRYQRSIANRKVDLERRSASSQAMAENLSEAREKQREKLQRDISDGAAIIGRLTGAEVTCEMVARLAEAVDGGLSPESVSHRLIKGVSNGV